MIVGSKERGQRMGAGYNQITNPESIRPGVPFLVDEYLPGEKQGTNIMTGVFMSTPFSTNNGRMVRARVKDLRPGSKKVIEVKVLPLGLELGFYDQAFRRVFKLPVARI